MISTLRKKHRRATLWIALVLVLAHVAYVPAQVAAPLQGDDRLISLSFRDAPLDQILDFYAQQTGKTMIKSQGVNATITLKGQTRLTPTEALLAIEAVLAMHNVALVPLGEKFLKVVQPTVVTQEGMPFSTSLPEEPFEPTDQLVSQIIDLKHVEISEVQPVIQTLIHGYGKIQPLERTRSLLITDTSANLQRILKILEYIDRPVETKEDVFVRQIVYAEASQIAGKLSELIQEAQGEQQETPRVQPPTETPAPQTPAGIIRARRAAAQAQPAQDTSASAAAEALAERGIISGKVKIVADDRMNILFIISRPENFVFFDKIIKILDQPTDPEFIVRIFPLEFADAEEIAGILNEFIGAASSEEQAPAGGGEGAESDDGDAGTQSLRDFVRQRAEARVRETVEGEAGSRIGKLSPETRILADTRTNSLLLMGRRGDIMAIENLLDELDIMLSQVLIETVIIEISLTDRIESGVEWLQRSFTVVNEEKAGPGAGISVNEPVYSFGGGFSSGGGTPFTDGAEVTRDTGLGSGALTYFTTFYDLNIDAIIRLAASSSDAKLLSTPVVLTTDNQEAKVVIGEERPIVTSTSTTDTGTQTSSFEYRNIGINLTVTPRINPNRFVVMEIAQSADNVGDFVQIDNNDVPVITKREFEAQIAVPSRSTIVLGGLVSTDSRKARTKVPILGDIPLLGALFRADSDEEIRRELIVLITPYVLQTPEEVAQETGRLHGNSLVRNAPWTKGWSDSPLAKDPKRRGGKSLKKQQMAAKQKAGDEEDRSWYVIKNEMKPPPEETMQEPQWRRPASEETMTEETVTVEDAADEETGVELFIVEDDEEEQTDSSAEASTREQAVMPPEETEEAEVRHTDSGPLPPVSSEGDDLEAELDRLEEEYEEEAESPPEPDEASNEGSTGVATLPAMPSLPLSMPVPR